MRTETIDTIYHYHGFWGRETHCRLRIARHAAGDVVIASELMDNEGTSITNMAEHLATLVAHQFDLDPARLIWIEHYGAHPDLERGESHDLVRFAWDGERFSAPRWKRVARTTVERLIGQPLEDGTAAARGGAGGRRR